MTKRPILRFAPSPNGLLHLGHAYSALLNQAHAERAEGRLLLRMEDIDTTRCRTEYEDAICRDLSWLGLEWKEPVRRQSEHFDAYGEALRRLDEMNLIRRSVASRREIREAAAKAAATGKPWPRDPDGGPLFPGDEAILEPAEIRRRLGREPQAMRLDTAAALAHLGEAPRWHETGSGHGEEIVSDPLAWGDVVLARKETPTSYHLSVVVDDALQGISEVVRGRDLYNATAIHRLLQELLGLPVPAYHHHRLVLDPAGRKLSKSVASTSIAELRERGATPSDIRLMVGFADGGLSDLILGG
ncbi:glutamyl-Q tRNA(Asp) synthetase [Breoghania corrubedonensis]|uniref:Glutamyl-Q tRNA(Asp) synthetase n=1 Tax=Breoghania corrubedonensis TaxID=665038 RepID=A0A2T5VHU3_9HYPH|nr:tRNA glutamyl-Q(34) synthetase GluQRS [Breoghania corrubedonensis]PTW63314.1 glutamyl-Q tRNA(Asp) synthetase [Breoghania corrubedonensis]